MKYFVLALYWTVCGFAMSATDPNKPSTPAVVCMLVGGVLVPAVILGKAMQKLQ